MNAEAILKLARGIASIPNSGVSGSTDTDLLRLLNEYLVGVVVPAISEIQEGYFSRAVRIACSGSTSRYRIHPRAMFQKLRTLRYVNASGELSGPLQWIEEGDVDEFLFSTTETSEEPSLFWIEGAYILTSPRPTTGFLEQVILFRPGELILSREARRVLSVQGGVVSLTTAIPRTWTDGTLFDFHSPHSGAEIKAFSRPAINAVGATLEFDDPFDGALPGEIPVEVGDWVTLEETVAVPPIPVEFQPLLAHSLAACWTESVDIEAHQVHSTRANEQLRLALQRIKPRVEEKTKKIKPKPFLRMQG